MEAAKNYTGISNFNDQENGYLKENEILLQNFIVKLKKININLVDLDQNDNFNDKKLLKEIEKKNINLISTIIDKLKDINS